MSRTVTGLARSAFVVAVISACVATPAPSVQPSAATARPSASTEPRPASNEPHSASTPSASPIIAPTPTALASLEPFPASTPLAGVPAEIEAVAWAASQVEVGPDETRREHLFAGLLNHGPTIAETVDDPGSYPWIHIAGGVVAMVRGNEGAVHVDIRRASDGAHLGGANDPGIDQGRLALDPKRRLLYLPLRLPGGGIQIHRLSFDGSSDAVLVSLDKRFTPDGIPTERYDLAVDPDGVLVVEACASVGGCRLWEIGPDVASAAPPRTLPGHPPIVCQIVAVSREWLAVQDDAACWADTGDAPLPVRAIRRSDGVGHLVTNDHVAIARVLDLDGRTVLVGADGIVAGQSVDIVTYDIETGNKRVHASGVGPGPADQGIRVSPVALPGTWVLLEPWFVESTQLPGIATRLLDLATGQTIVLPLGTAGWT